MSKVHPAENKWPNVSLKERSRQGLVGINLDQHDHDHEDLTVLTVWKRSSMSFQGTDGFTVFDRRGRLVFRVDNYSRKNPCCKVGLLLMDGAGKPLLTLKPSQVFSFQHQYWNAYKGEGGNVKSHKSSKVFAMRNKSWLFRNDKDKNSEAEVFMTKEMTSTRRSDNNRDRKSDFQIEGCFWRRSCVIMNREGVMVAKIARKRVNNKVLLGDDVFSLVVQPGFDATLVMAFVIVLDRVCEKPYTPVLCF